MNESPTPIRLLVVDDHPVVRRGLIAILQADARLEVVGEAENGSEAIRLHALLRPDLLLIDLRMPGISGVEAIQTIRASVADAAILIMTAVDGEDDLYRGLRAGALGYILKDAAGPAIIEAVITTAQGQRYLAESLVEKLARHLGDVSLSDRELEILRLMATGTSNKQIARLAGITEGTVKFHVNNILSKLDCASRTEAVTSALRRGLIRLDP